MKSRIPRHVAIVMDGNGRWAVRRGLPRTAGHRAGIEAIRRTVKEASRLGIRYLTLYAFSTENWNRPREEVSFLMWLLEQQMKEEAETLFRQGVRVKFIGDRRPLAPGLQKEMARLESRTASRKKLTLTFAINYGGRQELVRAFEKLAAMGKRPTEEAVSRCLDTAGMPDPDLIIRTAGEQRLSNFLIWQASYAEYWFTKTLWPDFTARHLRKAVCDFSRRERKFGGLSGHSQCKNRRTTK